MPWRSQTLCFLITLAVYLAFAPRVVRLCSPPTGDQPHYLMITISLAQDGDLDLANNYAQHDEDKFYWLGAYPRVPAVQAPYPLPPSRALARARPQSESYNNHFPGLSILLVPAWLFGGLFRLWWPATVAFMCVVGALVALNVFLLAFELTGKQWIAWAVCLPLAFSNPLMSYAYLIFSELPTALLLVYSVRRLALGWGANGPCRLAAVGLCIAYIPWLAWRCVIIAAPLGLYALLQWWRSRRGQRRPRAFASLLPLLIPVTLSASLMLWHNLFLFGSWVPPGNVPELGTDNPFLMPWRGRPELERFVQVLFGHLFDRQMGLLVSTPLYLLAFAGGMAMLRSRRSSDRRLLTAMAAVSLPFLFVVTVFRFWNGIWCPPARYLTVMAPLAAAPLSILFDGLRGLAARLHGALYALLAVPGLVIMSIRLHDPGLLWPGSSVWDWLAGAPQWPWHQDLGAVLPSFAPLESPHLWANTAWLAAASLGIVLLACAIQAHSRAKARAVVSALAWMGGVMAAGGLVYASVAQRPEIRRLTSLGRWGPQSPLIRPMGMTYLAGSLYLADHGGARAGTVHRLDLAQGSFLPLTAARGQRPIAFRHPGDVSASGEGEKLLYVLDNEAGPEALLALSPEGQVRRTMELGRRSRYSAGLALGASPSGSVYVADTGTSRVLRYAPQGGEPLAAFGGRSGSFNNVTGISLSPDGTLYAAETSASRVQVLDAVTGRFLRDYRLPCQPHYVAFAPGRAGSFEVSCGDQGLLSVDVASAEVHRTLLEDGKALHGVIGLAYAPDGTLYIQHSGVVAAYRLTR